MPVVLALTETTSPTSLPTEQPSGTSDTSSSSSDDSVLSTLAKAGISIGTIVGSALVLLLIGVVVRCSIRQNTEVGRRTLTERFDNPELHGNMLQRTSGREELEEGRPRAELDAGDTERRREGELPGSEVPELENSYHDQSTASNIR